MSLASVHARPESTGRDVAIAGVVAAVATVVLLLPDLLPQLAVGALGAVVAAAVARFPGTALGALLVLLPMQNLVLGRLLASGVPPSLVGAATNVKELVVGVLALVALREVAAGRSRLDRVDHVAIGYVLIMAAYVIVPLLAEPVVGRLFPQAPGGLAPRVQAFRTDTLFVVLFLAARHLPASPAWRPRLERGILLVGTVVAGGAIVEFLAPATWTTFTQIWADVDTFGRTVLGATTDLGGTTVVPGTDTVRAGSLLLQHLQLGFYLLLPLGVAARRLTRAFHPVDLAAAAISGLGILLTFTRSAVLAAAVLLFAMPWALPRAAVTRRLRAGLLVVALAVPAVWVGAATVLSQRVSTLVSGADPSARGHVEALTESVRILLANPAGLGLATAPSVPDRFGARYVVSENAILQIGIEAGIVTMVVFVVVLVLILARLLRRGRSAGGGLAGATAVAGVGLLVGTQFLHVWTNIPTALSWFAVAGVALNASVMSPGTRPT